MDITERLSATSFLLGMAHGGIANILLNSGNEAAQIELLIKLELKLRYAIDKLFYLSTETQQPFSAA